MQTYKDLVVWQKGVDLVVEVYKVTEHFPKTEQYGLTSQIHRAAVSIPANLAEGYARKHRAEYAQFVRIAPGSGAELETRLLLAKRLRLVNDIMLQTSLTLLDEVMRTLNRLASSLTAKP